MICKMHTFYDYDEYFLSQNYCADDATRFNKSLACKSVTVAATFTQTGC